MIQATVYFLCDLAQALYFVAIGGNRSSHGTRLVRSWRQSGIAGGGVFKPRRKPSRSP